MIIVAEHRSDLRQPIAVGTGLAAQGSLDGRIDEDARDRRLPRRGLDQRGVLGRPFRRIDVKKVRPHHIGG